MDAVTATKGKTMTAASDRQQHQQDQENVTLRELVEAKIESLKATMTATDLTMERRLEAMNELREQITSERGHYVTRQEHDQTHAKLNEDVRELRESRAEIAGKASLASVYFTALCVVLSLLIAVAALVHSFFIGGA